MATEVQYKDLLDAGVHFGHMTRKWNPKMAPYIFMERNGIHIIDLNKTLACLDEACAAMKQIVRSGRKIMFVATKKQAKELVAEEADRLKMPFVTERWLGGMLTNFTTVRKSIKKMASIERMMKDETYQNLAKRERLMKQRERDKLDRVLGGIADLTRLPAALFVIDVKKEHIAVAEAKKLGIPVFAIVDTNSDPEEADFPIPANDDAYKSIALITKTVGKAIEEGIMERRKDKDDEKSREEEVAKAREAADAIAQKKAIDLGGDSNIMDKIHAAAEEVKEEQAVVGEPLQGNAQETVDAAGDTDEEDTDETK
ncbi:small subunit ribosomal protein S2 [Catalinimonas alkaloidigena]|uniref:Small ribosomal subunit protein uS2 n=1 Tax=Catalinimonas alkaloidigena TaxID=1075417 RepID=A0A1G8ZPX9_9BACT|nr:30S ribosomal protein S2 [Catalinimonas alkaloidigena]SDK16634.1 small subunit ribosomal protein S2 [Catalinimonas alkaloidigena]